jgi:hypothetical protein
MTEGDRAFYKRRIREELNLARAVGCAELKEQHLRWAQFFSARLEGRKAAPPGAMA